MLTADEILAIVNDYLDKLPYNRNPKSLYEPIKSSSYTYNDTIYKVPFNDLRNMTIGKEKCSLYNEY